MKQTKFHGVFEKRQGKRKQILTKNIAPGKIVYDEKLIRDKGEEYRTWDPRKSKLAAAILKGVKEIGIRPGSVVLYLGASYGTTPSHVSDIVGKEGFVFALDFAPRVVRELVFVCEERKNMAPMMFDANQPQEYKKKIIRPVDVVYQDIAQREQAEIFLKNCERFLDKKGIGVLAVKARSVDVTKKPGAIFDQVKQKLEKHMIVIDFKRLDPYEKDHCIFICRRK
ncbi:fibrillarin-like rRNA/tRNA 2'-O-methyltransferase [Candidatus Woesearchaeota archaeon]|nr:fibrillarin-like rRNA/tRNA 2'-O-methyltransferase [Candidatus Woesearchaeota archaeon]